MKSTKGLSTVVATLIIILLTLVAVGIIWVVIRSVVTSGSQQVDINSKCLAVDLEAVSVNQTSAGVYAVTLTRNADSGGSGDLAGIKVSILNATGTSSGPMEFGALAELDTNTVTLDTSDSAGTGALRQVVNGTEVEFTPWFTDASGNPQTCSQTKTYTFRS